MTEFSKALEARIVRLEDALSAARLPSMDSNCECCDHLYVMTGWNSARCRECCNGCRKPKNSRKWVQGDHCPSKKKPLKIIDRETHP